jgi:hypothetical protein
MSTEQILMALVGGTGGAEPCGLLMDGYCVALAGRDRSSIRTGYPG